MMKLIFCLLTGYILGTVSPAALVSRLKKTDLRERGTKNLGATNTLLNFGKGWGAFVLVFDIAKSFAACRLAQYLLPRMPAAVLMTGCAVIVGHIFPFYMGFKGGKGLASFGGMILAYNPWIFLGMLVFCFGLMLVLNYSFVLPFSAAIIFPIASGIYSQSIVIGLLAALASSLIFFSHRRDLMLMLRGEAENTRVRRGSKDSR